MQHETAYQTHVRLLEVIGHADVEVLSGLYAFVPCSPGALRTRADALACVRDGNVWSELVPVGEPAPCLAFKIFTFHFDPTFDVTGFLGWLHSHLARVAGVGHIVVCGRSARGASEHVRSGVFEYWGAPPAPPTECSPRLPLLRGPPRRPESAHRRGERARRRGPEPDRAGGPGHGLFFPRRYTPRLQDLDDGELAETLSLLKRVAGTLGVEDYHVLQHNGAWSGPDRPPRPL